MPAVPVALAEVERRVAETRRRLNRQALIEVLCPGIAVVLCLLAGLVAVAARGSAATFQGFAIGAGLALLATAGAAAWTLRRRFLSLDRAAHVVDRRAGMQERLTTLIWLKRSAHPSPLAPLLIADTFDSAARWSPDAIAPRRFPWVALSMPAVGVIALAATFFLLRHIPPPPSPAQIARLGPGDRPAPLPQMPKKERGLPGSPDTPSRTSGGDLQATINGESPGRTEEGEKEAGRHGTHLPALINGGGWGRTQSGKWQDRRGNGGDGNGGNGTSKQTRPGEERALSAGLQNKIREALGENPVAGAPGAPAAQGQNHAPSRSGHAGSAEPKSQDDGRQQGQSADDLAAKKADGATAPDGESSRLAGAGERQGSQASAPNRGRKRESGKGHEGQPSAQRAGEEGHAGQESSPDTLFAPQGSGSQDAGGTATAQAPKAKSFKLTLSSFLPGSEAGNAPSRNGSDLDGASHRAGAGTAKALNPDQVEDDAMRRADIPPEYEDIVRRLYSSHTGD